MAEECDLVVCGANRRVSLPARVVYVDQRRGAGLELIGFSTAMRAQIAELAPVAPAHSSPGHEVPPIVEDDLAVPLAEGSEDDHRTVPVSTRSDVAPSMEAEPAVGDDFAPALFDAELDDLAIPV